MSSKSSQFPFLEIEAKWQKIWEEQKTFSVPNPGDNNFDKTKPKYYILDMFPYPSGSGLHVGHPEGYTATDIIARYKRMKGYNVLHPMGWDAFGLPAEQHAIKTGEHPRINTKNNIDTFRKQLKRLGFSYDWNREINTTDPNYVKWTQWIFLKLYNSYFDKDLQKAMPVSKLEDKGWNIDQINEVRLAYVADTPVNWSPDLGTVLSNEEVEEWRSKGYSVEKKPLKQWMLRITDYASRLIDELDCLDWPKGIKLLQKNWIGKSYGAKIYFSISGHDNCKLEAFTTRPDTLYGVTYIVISPEHHLVEKICDSDKLEEIKEYKRITSLKSDLERSELDKDKTGVFIGAYANHPITKEKIPIWISDYVMMGYGSGLVMAVPAHDERDYEFAKKYNLPIKQVVVEDIEFLDQANKLNKERPKGSFSLIHKDLNSSNFKICEEAYTKEGYCCDSDFLDLLPTKEAKVKIIDFLKKSGNGGEAINYKLKDWLFSRQRYWGEPFPIIWKNNKHYPIDDSQLPLLAPNLDSYKPTGKPEPLLSKVREWVELEDGSIRETNTMPQWAGSCWYYLRYCDSDNKDKFLDKDIQQYWMGDSDKKGGVDLYVGGTEHAVLHLLYARFWHKVLFDLGEVTTIEPFQKLINQGLILGGDGQKMSKSRGNVVNPDDVIDKYGSDSLRLYEMFMGPLEQSKPWSMKGVEGVFRFLSRVWRLVVNNGSLNEKLSENIIDKNIIKILNQTIFKVTNDIESISFNTAISQMMICTNELTKLDRLPVDVVVTLLHLLNPFAPHITEELKYRLSKKFKSVSDQQFSYLDWPKYEESYLKEDEVQIVVQVNGKIREKIFIESNIENKELEKRVLSLDKIKSNLDSKEVKKIIIVKNKLVNIVI